jgi:hypothetical protein
MYYSRHYTLLLFQRPKQLEVSGLKFFNFLLHLAYMGITTNMNSHTYHFGII